MIRINKLMGLLFLAGWVAGQIFRWPGWPPVTVLDVAVGGAIISELAKICLFAVTLRITRGKPTPPTSSGSGWPWAAASLLRKFANFANRQKVGLYITTIFIASWVLGLRLFTLQQSIHGGLYLLRFLGYLWVIVNAKELLGSVKKFIFPAFWIFVIFAWIQYLFLPDTRFLLQYGWDEHYYRMIGTVLDPNYLGAMLGIIWIYAIKKEEVEKTWKRKNVWLGVAALAGLVVTYSRASWVVAAIGLLIHTDNFYRFRIKSEMTLKVLIGLLIFGLVLYVAPRPGGEGVNLFRTSSIEQRVESWREGINVWREHPWLGVGFNNYEIKAGFDRIDHAGNAPSSSWILLLATTGVVGIGWLTAVSLMAVKNINRLWVGILVMIGIHSIINNTMFYPPILGLLAMIKVASAE